MSVTHEQLLIIKAVATVVVFLTVMVNLFLFSRIKLILQKTDCLTAFSSGIFLGAALIHLLADSVNGFIVSNFWLPLPFIIVGMVFILLTTIEQLMSRKKRQHHGNHNMTAIYLTVVLTIHSLFVGLAVGSVDDLSILLTLIMVVILHKWPVSLYFYEKLMLSSLDATLTKSLYCLFAVMFPLGVLLSNLLSHFIIMHTIVEPTFDAIAAGTFLFLATLEGLEESTLIKRCTDVGHLSLLGCGFVFMVILAII